MVVSVLQAQLFFLALTRILAMIIHVPILAGPSVPTSVRLSLGILLTAVMLPWQQMPPDAPSLALFPFFMAIFRELILGTLAGFSAVLTFNALSIAGELMGMSSGFSAGKILNPALEISGASMDQFFLITAMLIFIAVDGHHSFILGIQRTFDVVPVYSPLPPLSVQPLMTITSQMITTGVQLALPVIGALLMTDLTFGLLARVAPQIQVFFLGVPLKIGLGLITMALSLPLLLPKLTQMFHSIGIMSLKLIGG